MKIKRTPLVAVSSIIVFAAFVLLLDACGPTETLNSANSEDNAAGTANSGGAETAAATPTPAPDELAAPPLPSSDTGPVAANLVFISAGDFWMGSNPDDMGADEDEIPQHNVYLPDFYMYQAEVTNQMYQECVAAGECTEPILQKEEGPSSHYPDPEYAGHPVVGVNWFQAEAFCAYGNGRLPTEAEWEKGSRGDDGAYYPWGDDIPGCDQSNYENCLAEPGTAPASAYDPDGISPYEAFNMAGNVGEWTQDWYAFDYYVNSSAYNPEGPALGKLKVVRGGGFLSSFEDVRSADRAGFNPREGFETVGFRCAPISEPTAGFAPFCQPAYVPFCNPGGDPGTRITLTRPSGDPNLTVVGFGCPEYGRVDISVDLGTSSASGYSVMVGGEEFTNCVEYPEYPGRLYCNGPAQAPGQVVTVEVCDDGNMNGLAQSGPSPDKLVSLNDYWVAAAAAPALQTAGDVNGNCPLGYVFDLATGACIQSTDGSDRCPAGWTLNPNTYQCEPDDEGSCPPGSTYDEKTRSCLPDDGEDCAEGYFATTAALTNVPSCEPETNGGDDMCPRGYYFDRTINCCTPLPTDNFGCEDGFYYDAAYQRCAPITETGCPYGYHYDRYKGCVPNDQPTGDDTGDDCPPGTTYNPERQACMPNQTTPGGGDDTTGDTAGDGIPRTDDCDPTFAMNNYGQCEPEGGDGSTEDCGDGAYYDTYYQRCVETDDGCGLGYYYDQREQGCVPTDGPGSGCAPGFAYSERLGCCVPTPGNPGSRCPGDEEGNDDGLAGPFATAFYSQTPTSYDYDSGLCDPGGDDCPPGYYYDTGRQTCMPINGDNCPDGTTYDPRTQTCRPDGDSGDCPDGYTYDTGRDACFRTGDGQDQQCSEGYYFDYSLGWCVKEDDDGCAQGYYAAVGAGCQPAPSGDICPPGYVYDPRTQDCAPLNPGTGDCYTVTITVPVCVYTPTPDTRCPAGKHWNEKDQACNDRDLGSDEPSCGVYTNDASCISAGCDWIKSAIKAGGTCVNP